MPPDDRACAVEYVRRVADAELPARFLEALAELRDGKTIPIADEHFSAPPACAAMYHYEAAPTSWRSHRKLTSAEQQAAKQAWQMFKRDPFDPRLGMHKIHALSARAQETVHAVVVAADLRVIFILRGNTVYTFDIGTYALYRT